MSFDSFSEGETEPILRVSEEEFDGMLLAMHTQDLIDTVVLLQKEMTAEQDHFNMLSQQVGELTEGSPEYEEVAEEIVASQSRLAMLMGRNMKCFTQQTTLQNRELMEGFQDDEPNGEFSSSEEEIANGHLYQATTFNKDHPPHTTNKPILVNGHSSKTYQNGFSSSNSHISAEPVVRRGVPRRDYFEDSDSYPKLFSPGEGEPDICDDVEYCDLTADEDQTPALEGDAGDVHYTDDINFVQRNSENIEDPQNESKATWRNNDQHEAGYYSKDSSSDENNDSRVGHLQSPVFEAAPSSAETSKDIDNSIRDSKQIENREYGAEPMLSNSPYSNTIAQEKNVDTIAHKDSKLMVSISGTGKISLFPSDEKKQAHKGAYAGPVENKKTQDIEYKDQKKRFEALRKKFSEPGSFEKSKSDSDNEYERQAGGDEPTVEHRQEVQVPLSVRTDRNSRSVSPDELSPRAKTAAEKKRSEISMVLSIKTTSIHDNDQQQTSENVSDEIKYDIGSEDRSRVLAEPGKQSDLQDTTASVGPGPSWGQTQQTEAASESRFLPSVKSLANNIEQKTGLRPTATAPTSSSPSAAAYKPAGTFTIRSAVGPLQTPGKISQKEDTTIVVRPAGKSEGPSQERHKRVLTTLEVKQAPPQKTQEVKEDGRTSPFLIIEEEDVAELVVGKPGAAASMGNARSQNKEPIRKKDEAIQEGRVQSQDLMKEVKVVEKVNGHDEVKFAAVPPVLIPAEGFTGDEKIKERATLKDWDPTALFQDLYEVKLEEDNCEDAKMEYVNMEGYMEKLPINKKKATLLKTWKRRFFKAEDGILYYYESQDPGNEEEDEVDSESDHESTQTVDKVNGSIQLNGGSIEELGQRMLGIDDNRGNYLIVRCPTDREYEDWRCSLETQVVDIKRTNYVRPVLKSCGHRQKKVVIVDIGSCSVRAGILGDNPSLPYVFFPCVMATDKETGVRVFGIEALKPDIRSKCVISYPVRPAVKADKMMDLTGEFAVDINAMPALFDHIFKELNVDPSKHWIMFSAPGNFSDKIKEQFMDMLVKRFNVIGANIVNQTLLALYSYNSTTGVVVDVGERLEIVPVTDGYIVESGVTRQPYGGHRVTESLNASFTESKYRFFTDVEFPIVRLSMEKSCYVSLNYKEDERKCNLNPDEYKSTVDLTSYNLPKDTWSHVTHDQSRFKSAEGLFNTELWEMDNPSLHKLVHKAIQSCPLDFRRTMWRSIYLSGGVTLLPGFAERLQSELQAVVPSSIKVQVHASPQRYHSAYIGACTLSNLSVFEQSCITAEEWRQKGAPCLRKWHMY